MQDRSAVEKVGRYLLNVRAEYVFLITLVHTYAEDYRGVQSELNEFRRYPKVTFFIFKKMIKQ